MRLWRWWCVDSCQRWSHSKYTLDLAWYLSSVWKNWFVSSIYSWWPGQSIRTRWSYTEMLWAVPFVRLTLSGSRWSYNGSIWGKTTPRYWPSTEWPFGTYHQATRQLIPDSCSTNIVGNYTFAYSSANDQRPYSEFGIYFPSWKQPPPLTTNANEVGQYVFYHYQNELAKYHKCKPCTKVPSSFNRSLDDLEQKQKNIIAGITFQWMRSHAFCLLLIIIINKFKFSVI